MVARSLGDGIDDVILLNGVDVRVKVEKNSMGVHGVARMGQWTNR